MLHARPDYQRFQDPSGLIPDQEPVFLIRGQDVAGPIAVWAWADAAAAVGASTAIIAAARSQAKSMEKWQEEKRAKVPDLPE